MPRSFIVQFSMKRTLELPKLAVVCLLMASMLLIGCASQKETQQLRKALGPVYETAEQIKAMPPCKAKIV